MPIVLDHTIVPAHDNEASARFFAHIFGLQVEAAVSHFAPVRVFGSGTTRLQPAHVEDRTVQRSQLNFHLSSASAPARAAAYRS
jgi:hypothetical protein